MKISKSYNLSPEGRDRVSSNLPVDGQFQPSHGLYSYMRTNIYPTKNCPIHKAGLCSHCSENDPYCKAVEEIKNQVIEDLSNIDYLQGIHNHIMIHEFAQDVAYLFIIDRWISHASVLHDSGKEIDLQPVLKRRWTISESMRRLAESLSITPKQMIEFGLSVKQFKDYAVRAQELKEDQISRKE